MNVVLREVAFAGARLLRARLAGDRVRARPFCAAAFETSHLDPKRCRLQADLMRQPMPMYPNAKGIEIIAFQHVGER